MAANTLHHNKNPYKTEKREINLVLFTASEYTASKLASLSPIHLRLLISLACKLNPSGYACASLDELSHFIGLSPSYVNQGLLDLVRFDYIAKKKRGEYWVNPDIFQPAVLERF